MKTGKFVIFFLLCLLILCCFLVPFGLEPKGSPAEFGTEPLEFQVNELDVLDGAVALDFCQEVKSEGNIKPSGCREALQRVFF